MESIRSIGKISINYFTDEDIKKSEPWARKFYAELGTKSPFFRAWFGDRRAYDTTPIRLVDSKGYSKGEQIVNDDTGWDINVNRQVSKETNHHSGSNEITAVKYLPYIDDITKKAVLFDTQVSNDDNTNSLFYHSLYAYTEVFGYPAVLKLQIEELYYYGHNESGIIRRDYILQNITEEPFPESRWFSRKLGFVTDSPR